MRWNHSVQVGVSFGLTSGIITAMGLMVGLNSGTHSRLAVIGGILTIAIADAFSDALGIHISEESEFKHTSGEIWQSTIATFLSKFLFALTFLVPVFLVPLDLAVKISVSWGLLALTAISIYIAKREKANILEVVLEHASIGVLVVVVTFFVGRWISMFFG